MAFSYNLASGDPLTVEISKVRFELGDTVAGSGPRANRTNFTDEELTMVLDAQGALGAANRPMQTVAALCETLSREWTKVASISVGPRSQQFGSVAAEWAKRAASLTLLYGSVGFVFSVTPARADGYADNAAPTGFE